MLAAHRDTGALSLIGRLGYRAEITRSLTNRLRIAEAVRREPLIAEQPVPRPLFVVGLPRTGTTLLFNLLAQDPAARAPLLWELMQPGAAPMLGPREIDRRIGQARRWMTALAWLSPGWAAIHPISATEPEECLFLLQNSFVSLDASFRASVPAYVEWLFAHDMAPEYRYYRLQLQLLQWGRPPRRWVLKSPGHLLALDAIGEVFPDAAIVHLHREPRQVVGSLCSLLANVRVLHCHDVDPLEIGRQVLAWWGALLDRALAARASDRVDRYYDVDYERLVADPIGTAHAIHDRFGLGWSDDAARRMRGWLDAHPRERHGVHRYDLADYGLTPEMVDARFADYRSWLKSRPQMTSCLP